jgi:hypothetical protein
MLMENEVQVQQYLLANDASACHKWTFPDGCFAGAHRNMSGF